MVGPEAPLVEGIVDQYRARGLKIVGPTPEAARLKGSKVFAKNLSTTEGNTDSRVCDCRKRPEQARAESGVRISGGAESRWIGGGKRSCRCAGSRRGRSGARDIERPDGDRGVSSGEEVSFIALCDGRDALPLAPAQDHKAVFDRDQGPNTGGMGAYSDSRILTDAETKLILDRVIHPTVERTRFGGFLYAGLMMTAAGPKVLEFNVRLGDPETQPLMHRMESDFVPALVAAAEGRLAGKKLAWRAGPSVCVVLASRGYPGTYETGKAIDGMDAAEAAGATVFQAGTQRGRGDWRRLAGACWV